MRNRIFHCFMVAALSVACIACTDRKAPPADVLTDRALETETLLANAERGTAEDQYDLGMRYERGIGVPQSYLEAVRWYRLAAMQGYREGQYKLCELSERGQGLPPRFADSPHL